MREFTIRDKKFHLNGKPMYLKATFFEGLYPTKLAYPDSSSGWRSRSRGGVGWMLCWSSPIMYWQLSPKLSELV